MPDFTDQTGRAVTLLSSPRRIVSLVPSQTELLFDLGLNREVIGITKFCVHPKQWFTTKKRIGGTKQLNIPLIRTLQPDLILANKEENVKERIEELAAFCPVWVSDVHTIAEAHDMIVSVGELINKTRAAMELIERLTQAFDLLPSEIGSSCTRACYLVWQKPYMTIGRDTFIHDMLRAAGFANIFADRTRYPTITIEEIRERNPELLLLSSEPFPFGSKHAEELRELLPHTRIVLADGELFSWYGSRMLYAPAYFKLLGTDL